MRNLYRLSRLTPVLGIVAQALILFKVEAATGAEMKKVHLVDAQTMTEPVASDRSIYFRFSSGETCSVFENSLRLTLGDSENVISSAMSDRWGSRGHAPDSAISLDVDPKLFMKYGTKLIRRGRVTVKNVADLNNLKDDFEYLGIPLKKDTDDLTLSLANSGAEDEAPGSWIIDSRTLISPGGKAFVKIHHSILGDGFRQKSGGPGLYIQRNEDGSIVRVERKGQAILYCQEKGYKLVQDGDLGLEGWPAPKWFLDLNDVFWIGSKESSSKYEQLDGKTGRQFTYAEPDAGVICKAYD